MKHLSNLNRDSKIAVAIIAASALVVIIFLVGFAYNFTNAPDGGSSDLSSQSLWSSNEQAYLDLLNEAHAEDGDRGHTFANDAYAVAHGKTVCELLDIYYIETIADSIAYNNEGILYKVSMESKAYGIVSAAVNLCPEHADEVYAWMNN